MNNKLISTMRAVAVLGLAGALAACGSDSVEDVLGDADTGDINLAVPQPVNCTNPADCIAVTATWCPPGANTCSTSDVDLSLVLPSLVTVGIRAGESPSSNGCTHAGDEQAGPPEDRNGDGDFGPFSENISCNSTVGPTPIPPGEYTVQLREINIFDTGPVVVDIFVNGVNQRQIVNVDDSYPAEVRFNYP